MKEPFLNPKKGLFTLHAVPHQREGKKWIFQTFPRFSCERLRKKFFLLFKLHVPSEASKVLLSALSMIKKHRIKYIR